MACRLAAAIALLLLDDLDDLVPCAVTLLIPDSNADSASTASERVVALTAMTSMVDVNVNVRVSMRECVSVSCLYVLSLARCLRCVCVCDPLNWVVGIKSEIIYEREKVRSA